MDMLKLPLSIDNFTGGEVLIQSGVVCCAEYSAIRLFCNNLTSDNKVTISGGTIKGAVDLQNASKDKACKGSLVITGGTFGADVSAYVASGYTATESDGKWIVIQNQ